MRRGRSGCSTGKLKDKYPRIPESRKIVRPRRTFFSLNIEYKETKIKINGINHLENEKI